MTIIHPMRLRHLHDSVNKALAFVPIHLLIAVSLGYLLTGSFVLAGALALLEPALNTVAHIALDRLQKPRGVALRAAMFGAAHLAIAIALGWALTGSLVLAGAYAFIEPLANTLAHACFERWWTSPRKAAPFKTVCALETRPSVAVA
jgi:uncharacterized membrane protein